MLSGVWDQDFFVQCYTPLGELIDMLTLTNCCVNFVLYCLMSRQFRVTARKIFLGNNDVLIFHILLIFLGKTTSSSAAERTGQQINTDYVMVYRICSFSFERKLYIDYTGVEA